MLRRAARLRPLAVLASATLVAAALVSTTTSSASADDQVVPHAGAVSVFGTSSAWRLPVSGAPLNADSSALVANLSNQVSSYWSGVAAFNYDRYNVAVYQVPSSQPRADVVWDNCQGLSYTPPQLYDPTYGAHFRSVPVPADAVPAAGSDGQLSVWSPSSNQLWELWQARKVDGRWHACWGGRIDNVSQSQGFFPWYTGASASGLAVTGGTLTVRELQQGRATHALSLAIPSTAIYTKYSYPAQRSDGADQAAHAIPEGLRFRLDPSVDVDSLPLTRIGKIVAHAAQDYGFIVTDRSGGVAISAESASGIVAAGGTDPYPALLGGTPGYAQLQNFPWSKLQALPMDYGKP